METNRHGVVAFAFGSPKNLRSNVEIAHTARAEALKYGAPVFTQHDVPIREEGLDVTFLAGPHEPPTTLQLARGAVDWALNRGLDTLVLVTAGPLMRRATRDVLSVNEEHGANVRINTGGSTAIPPWDHWFCANSTQWWTRSSFLWGLREYTISRMPLRLYTLMAG